MKPTCNHVIVLDTIFEDLITFCSENNKNYMFSGKKLHKKLLPPEQPFLTPICTKSFVGWRAGALGKRGEGMIGEGRGGEGRKGEGPHDPLAWGPQCLNPALAICL